MMTTEEVNDKVVANIKLVYYAVNKLWESKNFRRFFMKNIGDREDAVSMGKLVLYKAIRLYNPAKGCFSNYVVKSIFKSLWKACNTQGTICSPGYSRNHKISPGLAKQLAASRRITNLDKVSEPTDKRYLPDENQSTSDLLSSLNELPSEEKDIVSMFYGIGHRKPSKTGHISRQLKISRLRVENGLQQGLSKITASLSLK